MVLAMRSVRAVVLLTVITLPEAVCGGSEDRGLPPNVHLDIDGSTDRKTLADKLKSRAFNEARQRHRSPGKKLPALHHAALHNDVDATHDHIRDG